MEYSSKDELDSVVDKMVSDFLEKNPAWKIKYKNRGVRCVNYGLWSLAGFSMLNVSSGMFALKFRGEFNRHRFENRSSFFF